MVAAGNTVAINVSHARWRIRVPPWASGRLLCLLSLPYAYLNYIIPIKPSNHRKKDCFVKGPVQDSVAARHSKSWGRPMSAVQATRAPLQIEKLTDEELLQQFAETREELCATALWKRLADGKLKWIARSGCPPWYDQEWMIRGCYTRAFKRFCRHVRKFQGKLETPSFGAYLKSILVSSVRDERRFIKGTGH